MPATTVHPALQAKIAVIRRLARERDCSYYLPSSLDEAEHEINRLVEIRVPRIYYGPAKPRLHQLCQELSQECRVPFLHPVNDHDARQHIKRLKSMKVRTAAMIQTRHHRPVYGTSGDFDTFGYGTEAYRDRGASMAPAGDSPSPDQMRILGNLAAAAGELHPMPFTAREAQADIQRLRNRTTPATVKRPSPKQLSYLRSLARQAGEELTLPTTSAQASARINQLLVALGRTSAPTTAAQS